jgi:hypothetical protein
MRLAPLPAATNPISPLRNAPLIASDGTYVAVAYPDRIALHDARTGRSRGDVAVAGTATELVARAGTASIFAALEVTPGTASVVAIDPGARGVAWSRPVAYSVRRLRVDREMAYVVDGNGRVWGLDARDATVRFGQSSSAFDVVPVRTRAGDRRVVVPSTGLVAYSAPSSQPAPLQPFLRWELEADANGRCHPRALSRIDGEERVVWERALPTRIRALDFGACDDQEVTGYRRGPRDAAWALYDALGVVDTGTAFVTADPSGVLALRATDGAIVLDHAAAQGTDRVFFDNGTFALRGISGCDGRSRRARVFARCGARVLYFNGTTALVLALDPLRVLASAQFDRKAHLESAGARTHAVIPVGPYTLDLDGIVYMH